jgi:hypothetical protein
MAAAVLAVTFCAAPAAAQWTPPVGVPAPAFGVTEVAPSAPRPWTAAVRGFYAIDEAKGSDDKNPYGTPARPRRSIPNMLPAGAVVSVRGKYIRAHSSPNTIEAQGTAAAPVLSRAEFHGISELSGSCVIVEGGSGVGWNQDTRAAGATHHVVIRDTELAGGGVGIGPYMGGEVHDIVVLRTSMHDVGDMNVKTDVDAHCVTVGVSHHVWILDSTFTRCSGDGVQVNGGRNGPRLHHVYIARNVARHNRQSGFWAKQSADVVMSSNVVSDMRPGTGGPGNCLGAHGAARVVFVNNRSRLRIRDRRVELRRRRAGRRADRRQRDHQHPPTRPRTTRPAIPGQAARRFSRQAASSASS